MKTDFSRYTGLIRENLQKGKKRGSLLKGASNDQEFMNAVNKLSLNDKGRDEDFFNSLHELTGITGKVAKYHQPPGLHPDFGHIKLSATPEYHYITSMFVDISKSTKLFEKYYPPTVVNITTAIQRAAIHIAWYFDGYVQRYHGDGLLLYFGGKNISPEESVQNAIMAACIFTKFVKEELPEIFLEQGIENIYTRIGIDVGDHEDTLWYLAGMDQCSEVTTCSLHTSLAAHMQGNARRNGIVVGDNVKSKSGYNSEYFSIIKDSSGKEDRYIFRIPEENFYYTQWALDWEGFLKNQEKESTSSINASGTLIKNNDKNMDYLRTQAAAIKPYGYE